MRWDGTCVREWRAPQGEVFDKYEDMGNLWCYVGHFHFAPFYVYSYAFADLVVGSLWAAYQTQPEGFEPKLLSLLAAGGTKGFAEALAPFGLEPKKPAFWHAALGEKHLGAILSEIESLARELGYM